MSSGWKTISLSSIATYSQGIQIPVEEQDTLKKAGFGRFIRIIDFTNPAEPPRYIKSPGKKYYVDNDDLVMIRYGSQTAGKVARGISGFIANNMFKVNINYDVADTSYIYRYLSTAAVFNYLRGNQSSSTMPAITFSMMDAVQIHLPPKSIQTAIADFFDKLDDRIALLKETNATLEAIAQSLFKSWFVEFDPVRAKQEGREPEGMDAATAALFPDRFEESELGLVPRGWRVGTLTDIAVYQNGYAFKTKDWQDKGYPVVKIGNVKPGIIDISGCSWVSDDAVARLDRFLLKRGDLLVGMTGYVGETGLVPDLEPPAYLNQRVGRISTKAGIEDLGFIYCVVRNPQYKSYAEERSHGSAQANVSGADLMAYPTVLPVSAVVSAFNQTLHLLINKILTNHAQAQTLATLRDTLLPRLISGQLRLPEAETVGIP
jgi:type I restriction enzyme, S subunit